MLHRIISSTATILLLLYLFSLSPISEAGEKDIVAKKDEGEKAVSVQDQLKNMKLDITEIKCWMDTVKIAMLELKTGKLFGYDDGDKLVEIDEATKTKSYAAERSMIRAVKNFIDISFDKKEQPFDKESPFFEADARHQFMDLVSEILRTEKGATSKGGQMMKGAARDYMKPTINSSLKKVSAAAIEESYSPRKEKSPQNSPRNNQKQSTIGNKLPNSEAVARQNHIYKGQPAVYNMLKMPEQEPIGVA